MNNLNISSYIGKQDGDKCNANLWNGVFTTISEKVNEIVNAINNGGTGGSGGTGGNSSVCWINNQPRYSSPDSPATISITEAFNDELQIRGTLYGNINIALDTAPASNLKLRLNGVKIVNTTNNPAIAYTTPTENTGFKDLVISIERDTENHIINMYEAAKADDQKGAVHSDNNLTIKGVGYLSVVNKGGHGIRGSELIIAGPHIYVEAIHDGIHAKKLQIDDGVFMFNGVNDCFGTGSQGIINFYHGTIIQSNVAGYVFNSKGGNGTYDYTTCKDFSANNMIDFRVAQSAGSVTQYPTKEDYEADTNGTTLSTSQVVIDDTDPQNIVYDNQYVVSSPYLAVTGLINDPISSPDSYAQNVNIYLNNAVLLGGIIYNRSKGRVKVTAVNDTSNYIIPADADFDGIKSENNIELELKNGSHLYICAPSDGIDGSEVKITDSKGSLIVTGCGSRGIKATTLIVGPNAEISGGTITYYDDPTNANYTELEGIVVVRDNCKVNTAGVIDDTSEQTIKTTGFADIYCRQGKKVTKGTFGTSKGQLKGALIVGSIAATIDIDFDNSENIYYNRVLTGDVSNDCGKTYENYIAVPENKPAILSTLT